MHASYLPLFCTPGSSGEVTFSGTRDAEELLRGRLLSRGQEVGQITDGVACFCEEGWSAEGLQGLWEIDRLWERNWRGSIGHASAGTAQQACDELAAMRGIILELAAGPGGGYMPAVLHRHPGAQIIANDHSIAILRRWREFLAEMKALGKVCFAAFDARAAVLRDASVAAVSGVGAFGNIGGSDIFREAYRVLQPGGLLFSTDHVVDPDDWQRLPEEFRVRWEGYIPGMTRGTSGLLQEAGFCIASCQLQGGRALDLEEGGLPKEASEHGVTLHVVGEYVKASKPA